MRLVAALVAVRLSLPVLGDFHNIHGIKDSHDTHAASLRLGQMASDVAGTDASAIALDSTGFQIYTSDTLPTDPALPSACATALTANVACNSTIQLMGADASFDSGTLAAICTPTCTAALSSYRSSVASACGNYRIPGDNNATYAPTLAVDSISGPYHVGCETDPSTGAYCNGVIATYNNGTLPAQGILGYPTSQLCTACTLGTMNATLSNPILYSDDFYATFQNALQLCGSAFISYNLTPPATSDLYTPGTPVGSNVTTSASCAIMGRNITTTGNATCQSLAAQYSITAFDVLLNNPWLVADNCTSGILSGTRLCLPQSCKLYTPNVNQTCADVADAVNALGTNGGTNITDIQITSFNPNLGPGCYGISSYAGSPICVSPHGGFPSVSASAGSVPSSTPTAVVPPPGPTASGTTSNCGAWYSVKTGDFCQKVVVNNTITLDEFLILNPEVNTNCTNLWAGYTYCVAPYPPLASASVIPLPTATVNSSSIVMTNVPLPPPSSTVAYIYPSSHLPAPSNVAPGTIQNGCDYYMEVEANDTCTSLESTFSIPASSFNFWNSNPTTPCPSLIPGTFVCILVNNATDALPPTPSNAASGSAPSGCAKWYTIVTNDNCGTVSTKNGITSAQFLALNPELNAQCTNLGLGQAYCVQAPPSTATTTSTTSMSSTSTSATSTPTGPPNNLVSGSWSNCTSYYTIQSGDTCTAVETKYNIAFTDLLKWNPELNVACTNIQLNAAYCAQGPAGTGCTSIYTVASGDYCSKIETAKSISDATLHALNPWLDTSCDLQQGQNLCLAGPSGKTTTTSTSTTTTKITTTTTTTSSSHSSTPTNIASGSWTNCTTYYNVQSGDSCTSIDTKYSIALSDMLHWNPELNNACGNLQLASYCVKATPACGKIYTVASGDYCSKIETAQGITDAKLRSLNPWIDSSCDLQLTQNLCVG